MFSNVLFNKLLILCNSLYESNKIFTHLTETEKLQLFSLASIPAKCYVEIGSYVGASSCFIAKGISKTKQNAKLYCVDTWQNHTMSEGYRDTLEEFSKNTRSYGEIIVPLRGNSVEIARSFNQTVDFIFIDGDHSYEGVKADVDAWFPKLGSGALVVFHDVGWAEGVRRIIREDVSPIAVKEGRLPKLYWAWLK